eukprot:TRINITY_DN1456_c0_g1_i1.p1 TRINITY_DN1456_c0_g1~~TRINITY_DN1456_c0_g1_i1.p1  ORF type:complete len:289 (+),score=91.10 TRINITY_DN1456_c0_g1_i1:110-976(+)
MSVPPFKDLGKQAKDVFEENYSKDVTVELKNFGQEPTTTTVNLTAAGAYKGSLQQKHAVAGFTVDATFFSDNRFKLEVARAEVLKGLKAKLTEEYSVSKGDLKASPGLEYKTPQVNVAASVDVPVKFGDQTQIGSVKANVSGVYKYDTLFPGVNAVFSAGGLESFTGRVEWKPSPALTFNYFATLASQDAKRDWTLGLSSFASFAWGAYPSKFAAELKKDEKVSFLVGAETSLNAATVVKTKFDLRGTASASLTQTLSPYTKLSVGSDLDVKNKTFGSVGVKVTFTDK